MDLEADKLATDAKLELKQDSPDLAFALKTAARSVWISLLANREPTFEAYNTLLAAIHAFRGQAFPVNPEIQITAAAFNPLNSDIFAVGGTNGVARVFSISSREQLLSLEHGKSIRAIEFTPDGTYLLTAGDDRAIRLWDALDGQELFVYLGHTGTIYDIDVSSDGRLLASVSEDQTIRIWSVSNGREQLTIAGNSGAIYAVKFLPDGASIVSAGADGFVRVWSSKNGELLKTFKGHLDIVNWIDISDDGVFLSTASGSRLRVEGEFSVRIWDLSTGNQAKEISSHTRAVRSVQFGFQDSMIISASDDGTVRLWDRVTSQQIRQLDFDLRIINAAILDQKNQNLLVVGDSGTVEVIPTDVHLLLGEVHSLLAKDRLIRTVIRRLGSRPNGKG